MDWNIAPECISTVVLCIIWVYSRRGAPTPTLKNRLFQICLLTTFCAMTSNIFSTVLIYYLRPGTLVITWLVNTIYFITTPLMGMVYFFYTLISLNEEHLHIRRNLFISAIPGLIYTALILLNPLTRLVFDISIFSGYQQGAWIAITYYIFYLYCVGSVMIVLFWGKKVSSSIRTILFLFPVIAAMVVVIQLVYPTVVLSGSAATCALLMIYLYLQNKQSSIDHLTGIPNRQEFLKMLEIDLKKEIPFVILVVSLRDFKAVNDVHGQQNGDAFLKAVSRYLHKGLELHENQLYRYSGDEFALLLKQTTQQTVEAYVKKIFARMAQPWEVHGYIGVLSAVIGVVRYPDLSDGRDGLLNGIEYAVTTAKQDRASSAVCYCTPEQLNNVKRRQMIVKILKECIQKDGFELYYQPILSVKSMVFSMAEALLRINQSPIGSISPGEFIPIAEQSGLIIDITYMVLHKACRCIRSMLDKGIFLDGISVNFSALQFTQKDLIFRMTEIIQMYDVPFSKIKVEITESTLAENPETITEYINEMHKMGIRIGLDDFGTGYSNLTSVIKLPIDTVKLDKSLVWSSINNSRFSSLVQNLTRAFLELNIHVLAEGVETQEQSQFVIDCGCGLIQGFLYARPLPEDAFATFLKENGRKEENDTQVEF